MSNSPFLVALILAGGQSSRMGRDKALILWHGEPMLHRVCQAAESVCQSVYILTSWPDRYQEKIHGHYHWLMESDPGHGPLIALSQGFEQIEAEWILLLACDLPQLDSGVLQQWSQTLLKRSPDILALVPRLGNIWQPLCGFYRKKADKELKAFIEQGGRSFQGWFKQIPLLSIPVGDREAQIFKNCNSPEDL